MRFFPFMTFWQWLSSGGLWLMDGGHLFESVCEWVTLKRYWIRSLLNQAAKILIPVALNLIKALSASSRLLQ